MTGRRQRRAGAADEALLSAIYRQHAPAVLAYALRRCSADDAADVVSETFVVAWRRIADVPDEPAVRPWLYGVARRVLANQRRGFRRRSALVRKVAAHLGPPLSAIPDVDHLADAELVLAGLERLKPADRELLTLANWEQLTPSEIAVVVGISGPMARKRLYRARQRLAAIVDELERAGDEGERRAGSGHYKGGGRPPAHDQAGPMSPTEERRR